MSSSETVSIPLGSSPAKGSSHNKALTVVDFYDGDVCLGVIQLSSSSNNPKSEDNHNKDGIQIDVAPGVDPAMIICLAAIAHEATS